MGKGPPFDCDLSAAYLGKALHTMAENTLGRVGLCAGLSHMETDVLDGNATCLQRTECVQSTYWSSRFDQSSSAHNTKYLRQGSTKPRRNEQRTFSHLYPFFPFSTTISISLDRLLSNNLVNQRRARCLGLGGSAGAAANSV